MAQDSLDSPLRPLGALILVALLQNAAVFGAPQSSGVEATYHSEVSDAEWQVLRGFGYPALSPSNTKIKVVLRDSNAGGRAPKVSELPSSRLSTVSVHEGRFVIGLSDSFRDPYNIIVWDTSSRVIFADKIGCKDIARVSELACPFHSGEALQWYDSAAPVIAAENVGSKNKGVLTLRLVDGKAFRVELASRREAASMRSKRLHAAIERLGLTCAASGRMQFLDQPQELFAWCDNNGLRDGPFVAMSVGRDGEAFVSMSGVFRAGTRHGAWKTWELTDLAPYLRSVEFYSDDKLDGLSVAFWPNGKPVSLGSYVAGEPVGTHVSFDSSGNIVEIGVFVNGELLPAQDTSAWRETSPKK